MKSLYNVLQESIFDDEEEILDKVEYKYLIDNIVNSKSFKEYESQISELNDLLKDNAELIADNNKKNITFKRDGIYLILLHKTKDFKDSYSRVYIGNANNDTTYVITASEYKDIRHNRIVNSIGNKNIKFYYKDVCQITNFWLRNADVYVYKIDGTKLEGLLNCAADLGEQTKYIN